MASIPVAWLISIFALLLTVVVLRQVRIPVCARQCFAIGLLSIAVVALFVGVRFQYNDPAFIVLQPYLAAITAPALWMGFHTLTTQNGVPENGTVWLLIGTVVATWVVIALPFHWSASFAVILVNIFYTLRLFGFFRLPSEAFVHIASQTYPSMRIAIISCLAFLMLVIAIDSSVLATGLAAGEARAMTLLSDASLMVVVVITLGVFAGLSLVLGTSSRTNENAYGKTKPQEEDHAVVSRLDALMADVSLFRDPELTVARLGRRLGVPARAVSVAVNRVTGENMSRYINAYRVQHAADLLERSTLSVTDIMLEAGFISKSSFNTEFRRITGRTPSDYRKAHHVERTTVPKQASERSGS